MLAKDCMLPTTEVVHLDQSLIDAANRLRLFSLPVLPVVDGDEIVGLLTFEAVEARQRLSPEDQIGRAQSELQSLMRISYAVFCLKKKKYSTTNTYKEINDNTT